MVVHVVFLQVNDHHSHVVFTVVVGASLISYLLGDLIQSHSLFPQLVYHFGNVLFTVNQVEAVG